MHIDYRFVYKTINLYSTENLTTGVLNPTNGEIVTSPNVRTTDFMPAYRERIYLLPVLSRRVYVVCFYDKDKKFISSAKQYKGGEYFDDYVGEVFIAPKGMDVAYMRMSVWSTFINDYECWETRRWHPIWPDGVRKVWTKDADNPFFKLSIDGKFTFRGGDERQSGGDYYTIESAPLDKVFDFICVKESWRNGTTFRHIYFDGYFTKLDCEWDRHIIQVTPKLRDNAKPVQDALKKELDVLKTALPVQPVTLTKRPIIQVYAAGDTAITNVYGGGSVIEQNILIDPPSRDDLINKYFFSPTEESADYAMIITGGYDSLNGIYKGNPVILPNGYLTGGLFNGSYKAIISYYSTLDPGEIDNYTVDLYNGDTLLYSGKSKIPGNQPLPLTMDLHSIENPDDTVKTVLYKDYCLAYTRIITDTLYDSAGVKGAKIPTEDIVDKPANYNYVAYMPTDGNISRYGGGSDEPTEWGLRPDGKYYTQPKSPSGGETIPVARNMWNEYSIWLDYNITIQGIEQKWRKKYRMNDAYKVDDILDKLIREFVPEYSTFGITSEFLLNKVNPISQKKTRYLLTPISNILAGEYSQAATKATTSLGDMFDLLRNTLNLRWYVIVDSLSDRRRIQVEHIRYYNNGRTYDSGSPRVWIDLKKFIEPRNKLPWSSGLNQYTYDSDLPAEIRFKYSESAGDIFNAEILMQSNLVTPDNVEEVSVDGAAADVDLMLFSPDSFDKDGFAILAATPLEGLVSPDTSRRNIKSGDQIDYQTNENATGSVTLMGAMTSLGTKPLKVALTLTYGDGSAEIVKYFETDASLDISYTFNIEKPLQYISITGVGTQDSYGTIALTSLDNEQVLDVPIAAPNPSSSREVQNAGMTFTSLVPDFWMDDLPVRNVIVNDEPMTAFSVQKIKKQSSVLFPVPSQWVSARTPADPVVFQLISTNVGNGAVEQMSVELDNNIVRADLRYDPEL